MRYSRHSSFQVVHQPLKGVVKLVLDSAAMAPMAAMWVNWKILYRCHGSHGTHGSHGPGHGTDLGKYMLLDSIEIEKSCCWKVLRLRPKGCRETCRSRCREIPFFVPFVFQLLRNILKRNIKQGVWEDWWQKGKEIGLMQVPNNFDSYETCIFRWLVKSGRPKIA